MSGSGFVTDGCGCPQYPGRSVRDQGCHDAWHALVAAQGGPVGTVDAETLKAARGYKTGTVAGETILDIRARASGKRASGARRRAAS